MKCPGSTFASAKVLEKEVICEMSCSTFADAKVLKESDFICEMEGEKTAAAQKRAEKKARQKANKNAAAQVTVPEAPQVPDDVAAQVAVPEVPQVTDDVAAQPLTTLSKLEHKGELQAQHGAEPLVEEDKFADALQAYEEFLQEAEDEQIEDEEEQDDEASVTSSMSALSMNSSTSVPLEKVKTRLVEASAVLRALQNSNITVAGFNQVCQALMSDSTLKAQLFKRWVQLEDVPGTLATPVKKTEKKTLSSSEKQVLANEKKLKYVTNLEPFFDDSEMQVLEEFQTLSYLLFLL